MHRFNISPNSVVEGLVTLNFQESRHALTVLRLKAGEVVELLDGKGTVLQGVVASTTDKVVCISVTNSLVRSEQERVSVTLAVSVIKPERMELMIQKACELGASRIVPLITERTVVKLSRERWQAKAQRWRKIAAESCKQCGRSMTPEIRDTGAFKDFLSEFAQYDLVLIPTLTVPVKTLYDSLISMPSVGSVLILIGPEGDFSNNEAQIALSAGAQPVSLGPRVLRSETAALYALSAVHFFYREIASKERK